MFISTALFIPAKRHMPEALILVVLSHIMKLPSFVEATDLDKSKGGNERPKPYYILAIVFFLLCCTVDLPASILV